MIRGSWLQSLRRVLKIRFSLRWKNTRYKISIKHELWSYLKKNESCWATPKQLILKRAVFFSSLGTPPTIPPSYYTPYIYEYHSTQTLIDISANIFARWIFARHEACLNAHRESSIIGNKKLDIKQSVFKNDIPLHACVGKRCLLLLNCKVCHQSDYSGSADGALVTARIIALIISLIRILANQWTVNERSLGYTHVSCTPDHLMDVTKLWDVLRCCNGPVRKGGFLPAHHPHTQNAICLIHDSIWLANEIITKITRPQYLVDDYNSNCWQLCEHK